MNSTEKGLYALCSTRQPLPQEKNAVHVKDRIQIFNPYIIFHNTGLYPNDDNWWAE